MRYVGSKAKLFKEIKNIILKNRIDENHLYIEPFVGGGNSIIQVTGNRWGNDFFKPTIDALTLLRDNFDKVPKDKNEFSEEDYKKVKLDKNHPIHGFASFNYSFSGKFWGGFCRGNDSKGNPRDFIKESYKRCLAEVHFLQNVTLTNLSYDKMIIPNNSIVYCDPPYAKTLNYKTGKFDHNLFWQWVREISKNNEVFVSEFEAPQDFEILYEVNKISGFKTNLAKENKSMPEKLFKLKTLDKN